MATTSRDRARSHTHSSPHGTARAVTGGMTAGQLASAVWDRLGLKPGASVAETVTALKSRLVQAHARAQAADAARAVHDAETADEALYQRAFGTGASSWRA